MQLIDIRYIKNKDKLNKSLESVIKQKTKKINHYLKQKAK